MLRKKRITYHTLHISFTDLQGEPYDISGDTGTLEAIMACCRCKIAREHMSDLFPSFSMKTLCPSFQVLCCLLKCI